MAQTIVNGSNFNIWFTSGATKKVLCSSTSCKVTLNQELRDVSTKDSGLWNEKLPGRLGWSISADAMFFNSTLPTSSVSMSYIYDLMTTHSGVTVTFSITGSDYQTPALTAGYTYAGTVYITSLDLSSSDKDNVTFSLSGDGTGALSRL